MSICYISVLVVVPISEKLRGNWHVGLKFCWNGQQLCSKLWLPYCYQGPNLQHMYPPHPCIVLSKMAQQVCVALFGCFYFVQKIHLKSSAKSVPNLPVADQKVEQMQPSFLYFLIWDDTMGASVYFFNVSFCCLLTGNTKVLCCNSSSYIAILPLKCLCLSFICQSLTQSGWKHTLITYMGQCVLVCL